MDPGAGLVSEKAPVRMVEFEPTVARLDLRVGDLADLGAGDPEPNPSLLHTEDGVVVPEQGL